jgi:peptidyl-prolyl isomerase H (cyclophilin H)
MVKRAYIDVQVGNAGGGGRLELVLYDETVPKTVQNFVHFLNHRQAGRQQQGYLNSTFHRIIKGFMAQGGDFINGDGTGSTTMFGTTSFPDENFTHGHDRRGVLSMANSGKDTNGIQFFITFRPTPHLNNKHVVFGHVDLNDPSSRAVLTSMENARTGRDDRPVTPIKIVDCGLVGTDIETYQPQEEEDENEIDVGDEEEEGGGGEDQQESAESEPTAPKEQGDVELPEEEEEGPPKTKAEALRQRMRKLKMKMNQARQLNKQEVLREGERLGSVEGAAKARRRQQFLDRKSKEDEWKARNTKALEVASAAGLDGKFLVEQADSSLKKSTRKAEKVAASAFSVDDYHNPEGMHKNYQKNIRSLSHAAGPLPDDAAYASATFDPLLHTSDEKREREGARNLANELKRRYEKQKQKRSRVEFEGEEVTFINKQNKKFNQKISRQYDKHTAEIRQNLERGTAL